MSYQYHTYQSNGYVITERYDTETGMRSTVSCNPVEAPSNAGAEIVRLLFGAVFEVVKIFFDEAVKQWRAYRLRKRGY